MLSYKNNIGKLSVIIVTYKSKKEIGDCLKSINYYNDLGDGLDIIVVDNSPEDDNATFDYVNRYYPRVRLLRNAVNNGFGQGNNIGAKLAYGEYLLFLNPDTILIEPIFKYAIDQFNKDQNLGAFGMILVSNNGKYTTSYGVMPDRRSILPSIIYLSLIKYFKYTPPNIYPYGADLFIRKDLFFKAGGFDENIFLCYEEPDLINRIGCQKIKIFNKKIIHLGDHAFENVERKINEYLKSEKYYFNKHSLNYNKFIRRTLMYLRIKLFINKILKRECNLSDFYLFNYYKSMLDGSHNYRKSIEVN